MHVNACTAAGLTLNFTHSFFLMSSHRHVTPRFFVGSALATKNGKETQTKHETAAEYKPNKLPDPKQAHCLYAVIRQIEVQVSG